jgi:hypothetical protein
MSTKIRVFFLSYTPPLTTWGGAMTFYRHFFERDDFDTLVATDSDDVTAHTLPYEPIRFSAPAWWKRMCRTRVAPWAYGFEYLYGHCFLPTSVHRAAKTFRPDIVLTVAGSWNWTAMAAQSVARDLDVPLVGSFNDWYDYGAFKAHSCFRGPVERRFREFYQECDLALCTSDGMQGALGPHRNAHVLYPTGASLRHESHQYRAMHPAVDSPFTVLFGGSLGDWYGPMMESIISTHLSIYGTARFRVFGSLQTWSPTFDSFARANGIFLGQVPFNRLAIEASKADLLLLPMGFGKECFRVESTSFKTKFLDYLSFRRPILIWGPDYCTAVRVAREFDSAECVTSASPHECATAIERLARSPSRRKELMKNATDMYNDRFNPDTIHKGLVSSVKTLIS